MLFVRAGAIALMRTGMHYDQAKFQALSAFTSTGFTTHESEKVVNHPARRKIISMLMIGGYAGIVAVTVSGTSTMIASAVGNIPRNVLLLVIGLLIIYAIVRHAGFMQGWENMVERWLKREETFEFDAPEELLHLANGYGLVSLEITEESPLAGQSIIQIGDKRRESLILGIERNRSWIPARQMHEALQSGDKLVIYGHLKKLKKELESDN